MSCWKCAKPIDDNPMESDNMTLSSKPAFCEGAKVYLRPLERADLNDRYLSWLNDPEVTKHISPGSFPTDMAELVAFYEGIVSSTNQLLLAVAAKDTDRHIGNVKLGPINWVHRRATFGIMIGDRDYWSGGCGTEATRLIVEHGFSVLNLHRIDLGVVADHPAAVRAYEKVGFLVEGRSRESVFVDGNYRDGLWMGLLRSEYSR
jgi:ribosomal-protein-alanine N-acetyltransferase